MKIFKEVKVVPQDGMYEEFIVENYMGHPINVHIGSMYGSIHSLVEHIIIDDTYAKIPIIDILSDRNKYKWFDVLIQYHQDIDILTYGSDGLSGYYEDICYVGIGCPFLKKLLHPRNRTSIPELIIDYRGNRNIIDILKINTRQITYNIDYIPNRVKHLLP